MGDKCVVDDSAEGILRRLDILEERVDIGFRSLHERIDSIELWRAGADKEIKALLRGMKNSKEQMFYVSEKMKGATTGGRKRIVIASPTTKISLSNLRTKC